MEYRKGDLVEFASKIVGVTRCVITYTNRDVVHVRAGGFAAIVRKKDIRGVVKPREQLGKEEWWKWLFI